MDRYPLGVGRDHLQPDPYDIKISVHFHLLRLIQEVEAARLQPPGRRVVVRTARRLEDVVQSEPVTLLSYWDSSDDEHG